MRFLVGTPEATHERLVREAEQAGVSVSLYVCTLIESHLALLESLRPGEQPPGDGDDIVT